MSEEKIGARDDAEGTRSAMRITLLSTGVFASMDALTKHVSLFYSAPQIIWIRYMVFASYGLVVAIRRRLDMRRKQNAVIGPKLGIGQSVEFADINIQSHAT